jgi:hypothetical protein
VKPEATHWPERAIEAWLARRKQSPESSAGLWQDSWGPALELEYLRACAEAREAPQTARPKDGSKKATKKSKKGSAK